MTEQAFVKTDVHQREDLRREFLAQSEWSDAIITPQAGDAGSRQYFHLRKPNGQTAYLMDMPYEFLKMKEFLLIDAALLKCEIRAPEIFEADLDKGLSIIEDMGDQLYADLFDRGDNKEQYILDALDVLIHLHQNFDVADLKAELSPQKDWYMWEVPSFTDWFYPAYSGHETPPDLKAEYEAIWHELLDGLEDPGFETLAMIDYHAPNLFHLLKRNTALERVGVIDFQHGVVGSPVYDVMSLLEDDRRYLEPEIRFKAIARYLDAMSGQIDQSVFEQHLAVLSAQRHAKNMGNFLRLVVQKHQDRFMDYLPKCVHWFEQSLQSPHNAKLRFWFEKNCPDYNQPLNNIRKFQ